MRRLFEAPQVTLAIVVLLTECFIFNMTFQENEDEQAPSQSGQQTPGSQRPRSNSGRELTDEVRLLCRLCI